MSQIKPIPLKLEDNIDSEKPETSHFVNLTSKFSHEVLGEYEPPILLNKRDIYDEIFYPQEHYIYVIKNAEKDLDSIIICVLKDEQNGQHYGLKIFKTGYEEFYISQQQLENKEKNY